MSGKMKALLAIMLLSLMLVVGCDNAATPTPAVTNPASQNQTSATATTNGQENMKLTVYYATSDAMYLAPVTITVPKDSSPAIHALNLLAQTPTDKKLVKIMPEGALVKGITIKDHVAYVNYNAKLAKKGLGSAGETLLVSSIVNTLTEFPDIQKVQILVEGKTFESLSGHVDISEPLSRSESIIKKSM